MLVLPLLYTIVLSTAFNTNINTFKVYFVTH